MFHSLMPMPEIHELHLLWNSEVIHVKTFIHNFDIAAPCKQCKQFLNMLMSTDVQKINSNQAQPILLATWKTLIQTQQENDVSTLQQLT